MILFPFRRVEAIVMNLNEMAPTFDIVIRRVAKIRGEGEESGLDKQNCICQM